MKPLVSVLILTYNQEKYIEQTLLAAVNQQCNFPYEIVISDDHSTDNTLDICRKFEAQYPDKIRLIANPINKGVIDNYYDSLFMCEGDYIADCAGDDYWTDPHKLQRQAEILQEHPEVSLTYTDYCHYLQASGTYVHHRQKSRTNGKDGLVTAEEHIYELLNQNYAPFIFVGTSCFRKDVLIEQYKKYTNYFRDKTYTCEDFQLVFFLLQAGPFYCEHVETTAYRILDDSISHCKTPQKLFQYTYGVFRLRTQLIKEFGFDASRCHRFLTGYTIPLLSLTTTLKLKKEQKAIINTLKELHYQPNWHVRIHLLIASNPISSWLFRILKR